MTGKKTYSTKKIGLVFPITISLYNPTTTASGGTVDGYGTPFTEYAEVKEGSYNKYSGVMGSGQEQLKTFRINNRPSLTMNRKSKITFDGVDYVILTIQKEDNKNYKLIIEAKAKL